MPRTQPDDLQVLMSYEVHKMVPEAQFLFLYIYFRQKPRQKRKHQKLDIATLNESTFYHFTRFTYKDICEMASLLKVPKVITTADGHRFSNTEGLFILCARLAYPSRVETLAFVLGWSVTAITGCVSFMLDFLHENWQYLLRDFDSQHLTPDRLRQYAAAVRRKGAPLTNCWAFLDCTIRRICRPVEWQREVYNGHKKFHSLKYSALKSPDGIMHHLYGPFSGRRNDNYLLHNSKLLDRCMVSGHRL